MSTEVAGSRQERKERTRQALLDASLRLLADRSLAGVSLREVTREVGIVPTAFYRHFDSMEDLGVALVEDSMRTLRRLTREAWRNTTVDPIKGSVSALVSGVRSHDAHFRFITKERYGGMADVRRAIATELRLFASELATDLGRFPALAKFSSEDLRMVADLMVAAMLSIVMALLDAHHPDDERDVIVSAEKQLRIISLGATLWRSK